jgi:hypothetical protein
VSISPEDDVRGWRDLADAVMGNVPWPAGAVSVDEWGDALTPDAFRLFYGPTRTIELEHGADIDVVVRGTQAGDGSVEERGILIHGGSDDTITTNEARRLAATLIAAADEAEQMKNCEPTAVDS